MEVLNSLLTNTVSLLFSDRQKHFKYFISEENFTTDKIDIPKSSTRKERENLNAQMLKDKQDKGITLIDKFGKIYDAKRKLEIVMSKIGLNEKKANEIDLTYNSLEHLENEKSLIKRELQELDKDFMLYFGRMPEKQEKEVYRLLYVYYKNIKSSIDAKKSGKQIKVNKKNPNDQITLNTKDSNKRPSSVSNEVNKINIQENKNRSSSAKNDKKNIYSNKEIDEFKKELVELSDEQVEFKQKLHDYQLEFLRKNNRKVKYYKDIIEVEYEYNKYKDNRVKIREIEDILSNLKVK
jgi:hypothetical protein